MSYLVTQQPNNITDNVGELPIAKPVMLSRKEKSENKTDKAITENQNVGKLPIVKNILL